MYFNNIHILIYIMFGLIGLLIGHFITLANIKLAEHKKVFSNDLEFKKLQEMKNSAIWQEQLFNKASSFSFYLQEKLCNHFFL